MKPRIGVIEFFFNYLKVSSFHLNKRMTSEEPTIDFEVHWLIKSKHPKYLEFALDGTVSDRVHLSKIIAEQELRNSIL